MTFKVTLSHSYVMERSRECFTFRFSDFYTTLITLASWKTFVLVLITPKNIIMCLCIILLRNFDSFKLRKYIEYHDPKNSIHIFLQAEIVGGKWFTLSFVQDGLERKEIEILIFFKYLFYVE